MARKAVFTVTLSEAYSETVSVAYATVPGTAVAPSDFTAVSGTLTFAPGQTTKQISVPVRSEDQATEERFTVVLSAPVNCTIADGSGLCILPGATAALPVASVNNITA